MSVTVDPLNVKELVDAYVEDAKASLQLPTGDAVHDFDLAMSTLLEMAAAMAVASGVLVSTVMEGEKVPRDTPARMQDVVSRMTQMIMRDTRAMEAADPPKKGSAH